MDTNEESTGYMNFNFKDDIGAKLDQLRVGVHENKSDKWSAVVEQYRQIDTHLFEWYCHLMWGKHCFGQDHSSECDMVKQYAKKLFYFFENNLKNRAHDLPEILEVGQGEEDLLGWLSYTPSDVEFGSDGFLDSVKVVIRNNKVCDEQRHTKKPIGGLKLDGKRKFVRLMCTHDWALKESWLDCKINKKRVAILH